MKRSIDTESISSDLSIGKFSSYYLIEVHKKINRQIAEDALIFQQIDIETYGENYKDDPLIIRLFGLTESGLAIICSVHDYYPYFYVKLGKEYSLKANLIANTCEEHLRKDGYTDPIVGFHVVDKLDIYGYSSDQSVSFLRLSFRNQLSFNACRRFLEAGISFGNHANVSLPIYESNIPLVLKFMVDNNVVLT